MRLSSRRAGAFLSSLLFGLSPLTLASAPPEFRIVTGVDCDEGERKTDAATTSSQGVDFSARPLGDAEWEARLETHAPGSGGLFRGPNGRPAPFQVFLVSLENRSRELLRFQPGNVVRLGGANEEDHILDYTDLYRYLQGIGKPGELVDGVRDEFFDSGITLDAGARVEKLLLFREFQPSRKRKSLTLLFSRFQIGTESHQAGLSWHYEKVK